MCPKGVRYVFNIYGIDRILPAVKLQLEWEKRGMKIVPILKKIMEEVRKRWEMLVSLQWEYVLYLWLVSVKVSAAAKGFSCANALNELKILQIFSQMMRKMLADIFFTYCEGFNKQHNPHHGQVNSYLCRGDLFPVQTTYQHLE